RFVGDGSVGNSCLGVCRCYSDARNECARWIGDGSANRGVLTKCRSGEKQAEQDGARQDVSDPTNAWTHYSRVVCSHLLYTPLKQKGTLRDPSSFHTNP